MAGKAFEGTGDQHKLFAHCLRIAGSDGGALSRAVTMKAAGPNAKRSVEKCFVNLRLSHAKATPKKNLNNLSNAGGGGAGGSLAGNHFQNHAGKHNPRPISVPEGNQAATTGQNGMVVPMTFSVTWSASR